MYPLFFPLAMIFQIFTPNRYKFNKKYRELKKKGESDKILENAKVSFLITCFNKMYLT